MLKQYDTSRGLCLILCYTEFKVANEQKVLNLSWPELPNNTKDAANLKQTFEKFNFKVDSLSNASKVKTTHFLEEWKIKINKCNFSCFALCVTSHGLDGMFLCDDAMFPTSELYEMFSESKCPKLSGRLKMFFIDACQGDGDNIGEIDHSITPKGPASVRIPLYSDFLFYIANYNGYKAWAENSGSWLTVELCQVLRQHFQDTDLVTMLTLTNERVAQKSVSTKKGPAMQIPYLKSTLRRRVMFNSRENPNPKGGISEMFTETLAATTTSTGLLLVVCGKPFRELSKELEPSLMAKLGPYEKITFNGATEEVVEILLQSIKNNAIFAEISYQTARYILIVSHELNLNDLKLECEYILKLKHLSEETAIEQLLLAHHYKADTLKKAAQQQINAHEGIRLLDDFQSIFDDDELFEELCLSAISKK